MKWNHKGHEFDEYWEKVKDIKEIYLFGAGLNGAAIYRAFQHKIRINGFIDNDVRKQGNTLYGVKIYAPGDVTPDENCAIVVTVSPDQMQTVLNQLEHAGKRAYDMHQFFPVYSVYRFDEVFLPSISYLPTTVCNLNCRCCLNFAPYLKKKEFRDIEVLKADLDLFFEKVDFLLLLHISGGEPFLYPALDRLLEYIADHYGSKIGRLETTTNGTVIPSDTLCISLADKKVGVVLDDYREAVPAYAGHFHQIVEKFKKYKVSYRIQKADTWIDLCPTGEKRPLSEEQLGLHFDRCNVPWQEYRNGRLYLCNYSEYASVAGLYEVQPDEYFDFRDPFQKRELIEFRMGYSHKGFTDFCRQCAGYFDNPNVVKPAEQLV